MNILALDPATRCGVATGLAGGTPVLQTINFGRELDQPEDIFARANAWIDRCLDQQAFDAAAVEVPVPKFDSLIVMGLYAIFCGALRRRGIRLHCVAVGTWRAYALGTAKLPRHLAKPRAVQVVETLGWFAIDHNAAEAGLIWLWCSSQVAPKLTRRPEPLFLGLR